MTVFVQVREWVIAASLDPKISQSPNQRSCESCGADTYEASLSCHQCGDHSEQCTITGKCELNLQMRHLCL